MTESRRKHFRTGSIPREAKLLIACAAVCIGNRDFQRVAEIATDEVNWNIFLGMATGHGMSAIAERALMAHARLVPAAVMADLRVRRISAMARDLYLANQLLAVTDLLDASGVPAIAFKGPTLAALAYDEGGLREYSDLDILVRPTAIAGVRRTLIEQGYRPKCFDVRVIYSPVFRCIEEPFVAADGVTTLDLHWRMLPHYTSFSRTDSLWARARSINLRGRSVTTLATEDLILFLCVHGAKHGWPLLSWVCDLAGLICRSVASAIPIDWQVLISRAKSIDSHRSLMLGFALAQDLIDAAIPPALATAGRDDALIQRLAQRVMRAMFRNFGDRTGLLQELIIPLQSFDTSRAKLRYLAGRAFTPTLDDWAAMPLPKTLFPFYYLTRPMRLAFAQAASLLHGSEAASA